MKGYKTYIGAAIVAGGAILKYLGHTELADAVMGLGAALGLVGVRGALK